MHLHIIAYVQFDIHIGFAHVFHLKRRNIILGVKCLQFDFATIDAVTDDFGICVKTMNLFKTNEIK